MHGIDCFHSTHTRKVGPAQGTASAFPDAAASRPPWGCWRWPAAPSRRSGTGATFREYLPATHAKDEFAAPPPVKPTPGGSETLLLAEDEEAVREFVSTILRDKGYRVIEARDGAEALALYQQHRGTLALTILDMVMPQSSGRVVHEPIRALDPQARVLSSTAYAGTNEDERFAEKLGVGVLRKPHSAAALLQAIRDRLNRP
jgi:CheY-like chemotaxis protein